MKAFIIIKNTQNTEYQRKGIVTTEMKDVLIMKETKSFGDFYKSFGLKDYPFNLYTAENETAYLGNLFSEIFCKNRQNLVKQRITPHFLTTDHPNYYEFTTKG